MSVLKFVCPGTGNVVDTGMELDAQSFSHLPRNIATLGCPHCEQPHLLAHALCPPTHRSNAPRHALFRHKVLEALLHRAVQLGRYAFYYFELPITSNLISLEPGEWPGSFQSTSTKLSPRGEASAASKLRSGPTRIASMSSAASRCEV